MPLPPPGIAAFFYEKKQYIKRMIIQFHKPNVANGQGPREFLANPAQALSKALLKFGNDLSSMGFMLIEDKEKILRNTYTEQAMNKTKQSKLLKNVSGYDRSSEVALFDYLNQVSASHKKDQSKSIKILEDLIHKLEKKDKTHSKDSDGFHGSKSGSASF